MGERRRFNLVTITYRSTDCCLLAVGRVHPAHRGSRLVR